MFKGITKTQVWKSIFRVGIPTDNRKRALAMLGNVVLHLHPIKVKKSGIRMSYTWCMGGVTYCGPGEVVQECDVIVNAATPSSQAATLDPHVEQADANQVERRAQRAHDQVLERRRERGPVAPAGHQDVRGQRGNLHEDENIERIRRHGNAHQARQGQHPGGEIQGLAFGFDVGCQTPVCSQQAQRRSAGNDEEENHRE